MTGTHLINGQFQSDKYPTTPRDKVPLSCKDPTAQDLLWLYAQRRRLVDGEFSEALEIALRSVGYRPPAISGTDRTAIRARVTEIRIPGAAWLTEGQLDWLCDQVERDQARIAEWEGERAAWPKASASAIERARGWHICASAVSPAYWIENVAGELTTAEEAAAAKARAEAIEECADFVLRITHAEDDSDIGEKLAVAFDDSSRHRPIIKRLQNYGEVLADNLRALATKPEGAG